MQKNELNKSLSQLEQIFQPHKGYETSLIKKHNDLLTKKLKDFTVEDFRLMIGQNTALKYLIPLAIEALEKNFFVEGDYYPGDLLLSVLKSETSYWREHSKEYHKMMVFFEQNSDALASLDVTEEIKEDILAAFEKFTQLLKE
jgi:hypothetical protein